MNTNKNTEKEFQKTKKPILTTLKIPEIKELETLNSINTIQNTKKTNAAFVENRYNINKNMFLLLFIGLSTMCILLLTIVICQYAPIWLNKNKKEVRDFTPEIERQLVNEIVDTIQQNTPTTTNVTTADTITNLPENNIIHEEVYKDVPQPKDATAKIVEELINNLSTRNQQKETQEELPKAINDQEAGEQENISVSESNSKATTSSLSNITSSKNNQLDLRTEFIRDAIDTPLENFIENQTNKEFSYREDPMFKEEGKQEEYNSQAIKLWLHHQHIQGISYKGLSSCLILNTKLFHIGEVINQDFNLKWTDIDPTERKLYFEDHYGKEYNTTY